MPSRLLDASSHSLDFYSLKELPESYKWGPLDDPSGSTGPVPAPVPIIDLDEPNARELIGHACKSWGVFQVTNHGVPKRLLDDMEGNSKSLFELPTRQKLKAARLHDGVAGYGPARISAFFPKRMWSEGFTILGSPLEHARQLWPNDYRKFCDIIEEYQKEMSILAGKLMWLILGSFGASNQDVKRASSQKRPGPFKGSNGAIQLNSYPACPDPGQAMGLAAHTDSTFLTVLHQSGGTSGLQVHHDRAGWVMVPPLPGGLVINVGDLLQILSNGQYRSVYHRAVVNRTRHRLSIAYLYGPGSRVRVQPISKLVTTGHPPLYRPVTWSEYLDIKAKYFNKALSVIRLNNDKNNDNNNNENNNDNNNKLNIMINGSIRVATPKSIKFDSDAKILAAFA
uniref:gibberellin 3beta-dioxygenase n=1 Tax=Opuntia streptacantha TaxID=393608 RepID=A0A7C9A8B9_OPUST